MWRRPWKRLGIRITLAVGLAWTLAGCAGSAAGATNPSTATPLATANSSLTPSPTLTSYSPPCAAGQLGLQASFGGAAMGKMVVQYQFTNTSSAACSLKGYASARIPGHTLKIEQVATSYMWLNVPVNTIELPPGASAYFAIQSQDAPMQAGQTCITGALTIYPPQSATGFSTSYNVTNCDGVVYLSPIVAVKSEL